MGYLQRRLRLAATVMVLSTVLGAPAMCQDAAPAGTTTPGAESKSSLNVDELVNNAKAETAKEVAELVTNAKAAVAKERYDQAKLCYKQALNASPDDLQLHLDYYKVAMKTHDWSDAAASLEKAFLLDPSREKDHYVDYGENLFRLRRYDKAQTALKKALGFGKDKGRIHKYLLLIAQFQKDNAAVEEEFAEYLKAEPGDGDQQLNFANLLYKKGKTKDALAHYKAASAAKPADPSIHETIGYILLTEKNWDASIEEYRKALGAGSRNSGKVQENIRYAKAQKAAAQPAAPATTKR